MTAAVRQVQVQEHEVVGVAAHPVEPLLGGTRLVDRIARELEAAAEEPANARVVIHDEDVASAGRRRRIRRTSPPGGRSRLESDQCTGLLPSILPGPVPAAADSSQADPRRESANSVVAALTGPATDVPGGRGRAGWPGSARKRRVESELGREAETLGRVAGGRSAIVGHRSGVSRQKRAVGTMEDKTRKKKKLRNES